MMLEMAIDTLKAAFVKAMNEPGSQTGKLLIGQAQQLACLGAGRIDALVGEGTFEHSMNEFTQGYMLGLQTARVLLAGMPKAVFNGVQI
jgi:hypothetical protein